MSKMPALGEQNEVKFGLGAVVEQRCYTFDPEMSFHGYSVHVSQIIL